MLEIKNLAVRYGNLEVFGNLSVSLEEGRIHALVGPSGCGKSTLLKVLCGIRQPDTGQIFHKNVLLTQAANAPRIGYVPQSYGLLPWKTLKQNIFLPQQVGAQKGRPPALPAVEADEIIAALGLSDLLRRYPREVSGGQQQRAALARAFIMQPDLLLMDEPFSALDAFTAAASRELFLRVWQKRPLTTLFITHSMAEAAEMGRTILLMGAGGQGLLACLDNPDAGPDAGREAGTGQNARAKLVTAMAARLEQAAERPAEHSAKYPDGQPTSGGRA